MVLASTNIGGAEMFVLSLLKNIDLERFQVDVVASLQEKGEGISKDIKALGCNIYFLPYFKVVNYLQYTKAWDRFLSEHEYDIVHGHSTNSASIYLRIAKKHGCATIAHSHSAGFRGNLIQRMVKAFFASRVTKVADYWFACSEKAAEHLYGKKYKEYKNYHTIPNAINVEKYKFSEQIRNEIRKNLNLTSDVFLCGHIGSFTTPKNHLFLLDVFSSVLSVIPTARLVLCGDGSLRQEIENKVNGLNIRDKVIFCGIVRNPNEYMMAMDVLVFPSLFEGFPITVIEAEATGLPVVMSDVITNEVDLTTCINRCSLDDEPKKWASVICETKGEDRIKMNEIISSSKHNIKQSVETIISLYDEMVKCAIE